MTDLINEIDKLIGRQMAGPTVQIEWPTASGVSGMWVENLLRQFGVRTWGRHIPYAYHPIPFLAKVDVSEGACYGITVSRKQFVWAYEVMLTHGVPILAPMPPTPRLAQLAADPRLARSKAAHSWERPVSQRTPLGRLIQVLGAHIQPQVKGKVQDDVNTLCKGYRRIRKRFR